MLEAICPPKGTNLNVPIPARIVKIDEIEVEKALNKMTKVHLSAVNFYKQKLVAYVIPVEGKLLSLCSMALPGT